MPECLLFFPHGFEDVEASSGHSEQSSKLSDFFGRSFLIFQVTCLVDRNSWWLKTPTDPGGAMPHCLGSLAAGRWGNSSIVNLGEPYPPLKGPKKTKSCLGKYSRLIFIQKENTSWYRSDRDKVLYFQFWRKFGLPVLLLLPLILAAHIFRHHNRWRLMIPKTYGESTHVKLVFFEQNFQPSNPQNLYQNRKVI